MLQQYRKWWPLPVAIAIIAINIWLIMHAGSSTDVKALKDRLKSAVTQNTLLHQHNAQLDATNAARQARIDTLAGRNTVLLSKSKTYRDSTEKLKKFILDVGIPTTPSAPGWMVRSLNQDTIIARQDTTIETLTLVTINDTAQIDLFRRMYKADSAFKDSVLTHADTVLHIAKDAVSIADCRFAHFFHCPSRKEAFVVGAGTAVVAKVVYDLFIKPRLPQH